MLLEECHHRHQLLHQVHILHLDGILQFLCLLPQNALLKSVAIDLKDQYRLLKREIERLYLFHF